MLNQNASSHNEDADVRDEDRHALDEGKDHTNSFVLIDETNRDEDDHDEAGLMEADNESEGVRQAVDVDEAEEGMEEFDGEVDEADDGQDDEGADATLRRPVLIGSGERLPPPAPTVGGTQVAPTLFSRARHALYPGGRMNRHAGVALGGVGVVVLFIVMLGRGNNSDPFASPAKKPNTSTATLATPMNSSGTATRVMTSGGPPDQIGAVAPPPPQAQATPASTSFTPQPPLVSAPYPYTTYNPSVGGRGRDDAQRTNRGVIAGQFAAEADRSGTSNTVQVDPFAFTSEAAFATQLSASASSSNNSSDSGRPATAAATAVAALGQPQETTNAENSFAQYEFDNRQQHTTSKADNEGMLRLPRGTRINMELLEPAASGIETFVRVRVTRPVMNADGEAVIPVGTEGQLPFAAGEFYARLTLRTDKQAQGFLRVGNREVVLRGSIKGADNRAGIKGEVHEKKGQPNILGRGLRSAARVVAGSLGTVGSSAVYETEQAMGSGGGVASYSREVVAPAGTTFTFVVGL